MSRDRKGLFNPQMALQGSRRLSNLDDMVISLYDGGIAVRDIQQHLASTLGVQMSPDTICTVTDAVLQEVMIWKIVSLIGLSRDVLTHYG